MLREYELYIDIDASKEQVWNAITDFKNYRTWNTFLPFVDGSFKKGSALFIKAKESDAGSLISVEDIEEGEKFVLSRYFIHPSLIHLIHHFEVETNGSGITRFTQRWEGHGLLTLIIWSKLCARMKKFDRFNSDLKNHLESDSFSR